MYLVVIGAEKEGECFVDLAVKDHHEVTLIDPSEEKARRILKEIDVRVLVGDIGEDDILQEAEIERADAVIATTYDDAQNLMAMVLAQEYKINKLISLVNQQSHDTIFKKLGVQIISNPARVIASRLYDCVG